MDMEATMRWGSIAFLLVAGCAAQMGGDDGGPSPDGGGADLAPTAGDLGRSPVPDLGATPDLAWGDMAAKRSGTIEPSGVTGDLHAIWGSSASDIYVAADAGAILHSTGAGTWTKYAATQTGADSRFAISGLWGSSPTNVFAVQNGYYVDVEPPALLHSTGGGVWTLTRFSVTNEQMVNAIWGAGSDLFVVGGHGVILHSKDGGTTWALETSGTMSILTAVWGSSASDVYVVGNAGVLLHSTGNGTWTPETVPMTDDLRSVWGSGAGDVYVGAHGGVLLHSTGNGTWTAQNTNSPDLINGIWGASASDVYLAIASGVLRGSGNGQWSAQAAGTQPLIALWGSGSGDVYAVGLGGLIVHQP
jgi:photosystem II stability/assembly factor-like uncharacterized protein